MLVSRDECGGIYWHKHSNASYVYVWCVASDHCSHAHKAQCFGNPKPTGAATSVKWPDAAKEHVVSPDLSLLQAFRLKKLKRRLRGNRGGRVCFGCHVALDNRHGLLSVACRHGAADAEHDMLSLTCVAGPGVNMAKKPPGSGRVIIAVTLHTAQGFVQQPKCSNATHVTPG